jgi:hypothetical protein
VLQTFKGCSCDHLRDGLTRFVGQIAEQSRETSAPCCLGSCVDGTAGQMAPGTLPVQVRVRVRLWALGFCSCLHCTTKLTE